MAIPSHLQNALSYTDSGIPFAWLLDGYKETRAADGNALVLQCLVGWSDSEDWIREVTGYTTWNGASPYFNRRLPLECPLIDGLWLDHVEAIGTGHGKDTTTLCDPFNNNAPLQDWIRYACTFLRPKWWIRSDDALNTDWSLKEQHRYVQRSFRYVPRERRIPAYGFEIDENPEGAASWRRIEETAFLPDYQIEYLFTWKQVPIDAVPWDTYEGNILTVNSTAFTIPGNSQALAGARSYDAGTLLFKGISQAMDWYQGADGNYYFDPQIVMSYQPGGWNKQLLRARDGGGARRYGNVRHFGISPDTAPYAETDFQLLFRPPAP